MSIDTHTERVCALDAVARIRGKSESVGISGYYATHSVRRGKLRHPLNRNECDANDCHTTAIGRDAR